MTDYAGLIQLLVDHEVEFILVGGFAATLHGSARLTLDLDIVYNRSDENFKRLSRALENQNVNLRGAPAGLPFVFDISALKSGLNFTLTTNLGSLDLLGQITGGGAYRDLLNFCISIEIFDRECLVIDLEKLIELKRAAGRPKDLEAIAELEEIADEQSTSEQ